MFINYVYYQMVHLENLNVVGMQDQTKRYFSDLYRSYQMPFDINKIETICRYDDIASCLFDDKYNQAVCAVSDYLFFPSWGWILDSNSVVWELYLKNKFKWDALILDIRDCGSLCAYYALHLMLKLHKNSLLSNSACCSVENIFQLGAHSRNLLFPKISYVGLLSFSKTKKSYLDIEILYCDICRNVTNFKNQKAVLEKIIQIAQEYNIGENQYHIIMRHIGDNNTSINKLDLITHPISSGFLYDILNQIIKKHIKIAVDYVFIIDFDFKTGFFGVVLIKLGGNDVNAIA